MMMLMVFFSPPHLGRNVGNLAIEVVKTDLKVVYKYRGT